MGDWSLSVSCLGEATLARLSELLDNSTRGWRKLADLIGTERRFKCSEKELENCSLQVLAATGSPSRYLLQLLSERACTLRHLLNCLEKMGHKEAAQLLTSAVQTSIRITIQPDSCSSVEGEKVSLICQAAGPPGLGYQWFRGNQEVTSATSSVLVFNSVSLLDAGWYICRIHHGNNCTFSQWAQLRVTSGRSPTENGYCATLSGLKILVQPNSQVQREGDTLELVCSAIGNPPPQYQWFKDGRPVPDAKLPKFKAKCVTTAESGKYRCQVFNLFQEIWSTSATVVIGSKAVVPGEYLDETYTDSRYETKQTFHQHHSVPEQSVDPTYDPGMYSEEGCREDIFGSVAGTTEDEQFSRTCQTSSFYATDKVALLIGNMNYLYHKQLKAPMVDVHELTNLLCQLNFKVVSLLDLTKCEMQRAVREFLMLLDKGVYGLLYYAGHGYENFGNSFMVPIDAPGSYTSEHCLCVQGILYHMQQRQTGLNVFLLDMCRKRNINDDIIPLMGAQKVTANIVFGYATCVDAEAYEVSQGVLSNGIFVSFLKRRLLEDEKITVLLDKVAEDMGQCEITKGRQALELRSNLSERRALTDKIKQSSSLDEHSARNLQWAKAHVLPESRYITFDCGIKVQLGFAAEFSNILIIYTRIVETPPGILWSEARLTDFTENLDIDLKFMNKESPEETGSILFTTASLNISTTCLYTRLCSLQKLKKELIFSICLQYQYKGIDDFIQERQVVNIGRPLVAKLNLHTDTSLKDYLQFDNFCSSQFLPSYPCIRKTSVLPSMNMSPLEAKSTGSDSYMTETTMNSIQNSSSTDTECHLSTAKFNKVNIPEETLSPEFDDTQFHYWSGPITTDTSNSCLKKISDSGPKTF
ncbi:mucosa-associated lymphoid tissue lymphoma translocation protein 1-like [Protopterus annectens]|uniref:mucosa-associated lymphoid tissue lymphoma translocation protein 1-like n=1 Tax=Protopterus annectens TaxID=7888 RepID=UPI001CF999C1|nr:mucosa-associated lymphoid tissue lymphoma translocation protein 1-like [Protopterus annectens]